MGLFDNVQNMQGTPNSPMATGPAPAPAASPFGGMQMASFLGMLAGALGGPNSAGGRVGQGVQQAANGQMMANTMLAREQGQREFLQKLLQAHNKLSDETAKQLGGETPESNGGGLSSYFGSGGK